VAALTGRYNEMQSEARARKLACAKWNGKTGGLMCGGDEVRSTCIG